MPRVAAPARLRHPRLAAERVEARPSRCQISSSGRSRTLSNDEPGQRVRGVARQHEAVGRDDDEAAPPAVHARFRELGVVVRASRTAPPSARAAAGAPRGRPRARGRAARGVGRSARRLASAQPRYCVLASSSRSAPSDSASAMNSGTRSRLSRWSTTLSVSGRPSSLTAARDLQLALEGAERRRCGPTPARVTSCTDTCTLSRPAALSRASRSRVQRDAAGDQVGVEVERRARPPPAPRDRRRTSGSPPVRFELHDAERLRLARRPAASPRCRARRAWRASRAGSSSRRSAAGSGRSARRPACTGAAAVASSPSLRDQPALGHAREERQHLALDRAPRGCARVLRGQLRRRSRRRVCSPVHSCTTSAAVAFSTSPRSG